MKVVRKISLYTVTPANGCSCKINTACEITLHWCTFSVVREIFLWKLSKSHKEKLEWESLLEAVWRPATLLKRNNTGVFLWILQNFKNTPVFKELLRWLPLKNQQLGHREKVERDSLFKKVIYYRTAALLETIFS